jgi:pimeloyl-ACP methyl ester carboxylesterase
MFPRASEAQLMAETRYISVRYNDKRIRIASSLRLMSDNLLLFMHGFGCTKESFAEAFSQESLKDFSICTFDFPGHGQSTVSDSSMYSMQSYADIANQLIDRLAPRRVFLACHSMGGAVGLIASQGRRDIGCYVSVEGNMVAKDCGLVSRTTAAQSSTEYLDGGYREFLGQLRQSSRRDYLAWARWCAQADPAALHQTARSLVEWSDSGKLLDWFRSLSRKAYLYGEDEDKQYLLPRLAKEPVYSIANAGHFVMIDNPIRFYAVLADVLLNAKD